MKILIAVPCMDQVPAQFAHSLATMSHDNCIVAMQIGSLIYSSRNSLALTAIKEECDYVLWLDSDMIFPPNILDLLMQHKDKGDIITGCYYRRVPPYHPVLFSKLEITDKGSTQEDVTEIPDGLFEVEGCGFGCVLMPTHILVECFSTYGDLFSPIHGVGEDLSFCWRARQLGYRIVCDPSIYLGHVGHYVVDQSFYRSFNRKEEV